MRIKLLAAACMLALSACSPSLKHDINMPNIPAAGVSKNLNAGGVELLVNPFIDSRSSATIIFYRDKQLKAKGDAAAAVEAKVKQQLEQGGFAFNTGAPIALSGELRTWEARVSSGFPAEVTSKAAVYVEVRDPTNKRIYSGEYSGTASKEHPNLDEKDVSETLGTAMQQAINQLFADQQLMDILQSF